MPTKDGLILCGCLLDNATHTDGLGWNPNGVFCGECTYFTCENCKHKEVKENER